MSKVLNGKPTLSTKLVFLNITYTVFSYELLTEKSDEGMYISLARPPAEVPEQWHKQQGHQHMADG